MCAYTDIIYIYTYLKFCNTKKNIINVDHCRSVFLEGSSIAGAMQVHWGITAKLDLGTHGKNPPNWVGRRFFVSPSTLRGNKWISWVPQNYHFFRFGKRGHLTQVLKWHRWICIYICAGQNGSTIIRLRHLAARHQKWWYMSGYTGVNYNDLSRGHPKWWFSKGILPKIPKKFRFRNYRIICPVCDLYRSKLISGVFFQKGACEKQGFIISWYFVLARAHVESCASSES